MVTFGPPIGPLRDPMLKFGAIMDPFGAFMDPLDAAMNEEPLEPDIPPLVGPFGPPIEPGTWTATGPPAGPCG